MYSFNIFVSELPFNGNNYSMYGIIDQELSTFTQKDENFYVEFSQNNNEFSMSFDGSDDNIEIVDSNFKIGLIDFSDNDYFQTLRSKMGWGKRGNVN